MTIRKLQRTIGQLYGYRQPVRRQYTALIGHPDGTIDDPENPGHVFVRLAGEDSRIRHALCRTVVPRYNLQVKVAYNDEWPNVLEVVNEEIAGFPPNANDPETPTSWTGMPTLGRHAPQHELTGGDTVYIQSSQLLPLGAFQNSTPNMRVVIKSGWYPYGSGFNWFPGAVSQDMTAFRPSTSGVTNWRIIFIEGSTNTLGYTQTGDVASDISPIETILDSLGVGRVPICAIALIQGMTTIKQADIFDLRVLIGTTPGTVAAGGGSGVLWANVLIVAASGGDYADIQAANAAASSSGVGTFIWVAPGTYIQTITGKTAITIAAMADPFKTSIAPTSGSPLTVPSGTISCRFFSLRFNPPASTVAVIVNGTSGDTTLWRCYVDANGAASIDASGAAAGYVLYLEEVETEGNVLLACVAALRDCRIGGNLTQSAGAGNLTIDGGSIDGNLTTVVGSTITLRNLPRIGGAVSGTGTLRGAYINGSGHVVIPANTLIESRTSLYEFQNFI